VESTLGDDELLEYGMRLVITTALLDPNEMVEACLVEGAWHEMGNGTWRARSELNEKRGNT